MPKKNNHSRKNGIKAKSSQISKNDQILLKRIGLLVHQKLFEFDKPVEWLSFKSGFARSSIREIIAGRSNTRILTLNSLAKSLGYQNVIELLEETKKRTDLET
jgi:hypothetical protein